MYYINKDNLCNSICNMPLKKSLKQSDTLKFTVVKRKEILETTIIASPKHLNHLIKPLFPSDFTLSINVALN